MLKMTDAAASIDLTRTAEQTMEVISELISPIIYIYEADFHNLEERYNAGAREKQVRLVNILLCDPPYNVRPQS